MFIPIGDENPTERKPYVNYALIAINVVVFLITLALPGDAGYIGFEMIPGDLHWHTLFTSMFLHAGPLHLLGNMIFLWIFGDNVEDKLGHVGYAVFYLVCGLAADGAHIASNPASQIPTVGASGAISGVMGAYVVFFPHARVKTFVWLGIWYANVIRTPAWIWIGIWFLQQVLFNSLGPDGGGGVAYLAHIGGFIGGAMIGGAIRLVRDRMPATAPAAQDLDARSAGRRPFLPVSADADVDWVDDEGDGYSVLLLAPDRGNVGRLSEMVAAVTDEPAFDVVDRLVVTRGRLARSIPRDTAVRVQRELQAIGIPTAIIFNSKANRPPAPVPAEGASWDDRILRLRVGDQVLQVPWLTPFLFSAARIKDRPFIDVFVNRRTVYRIVESRSVPLTEVDVDGRAEKPATLAVLARAMAERGRPTAVHEGLRALAGLPDGGRLDFNSAADYDDYVFWLYHVILSRE